MHSGPKTRGTEQVIYVYVCIYIYIYVCYTYINTHTHTLCLHNIQVTLPCAHAPHRQATACVQAYARTSARRHRET